MAMTKTTLSVSAWTGIPISADVDTLVVIQGSARLCSGPPSASLDLGFSVSDGYQIIVPAGLQFYGISVGGPSVAVVGPFGV